jgi:DNA-binding FadR family transcriptional regulator
LKGREQTQRASQTKRASVARPKLAELVQNRLLAVIRAENLRPGDPLPSERELMQSYAVGGPSIREAMQNLKRMGLIEINHGERPRVAAPSFERMVADMSETMRHVLMNSPATLDHLKEARASFEMTIAQIAARKRTKDDVEDLRRILSEQEQARLDSNAFLEADGRFHHRIAIITGNPIFAQLSPSLFAWLAGFHFDLVRKPGLE